MHLLASLPGSFEMLVTSLEVNSETIPKMEVVTEQLLHEEQKQNEKGAANSERKALAAKGNSKKGPICHFCRKPGHLKRECSMLAKLEASKKAGKGIGKPKHAANQVTENQQECSQDDDDEAGYEALVVSHACSVSPRTSGSLIQRPHVMCNEESFFIELREC